MKHRIREESLKILVVQILIVMLGMVYGLTPVAVGNELSVSKILLNAQDLPGYYLKHEGLMGKTHSQIWLSSETVKNVYLSIRITVYDSNVEAIVQTATIVGYISGFLPYGSKSGLVIGDHSWFGTGNNYEEKNDSVIYFAKNNVGVSILLVGKIDTDKELTRIVDKIQAKIALVSKEQDLSLFEQARKTQIAESEFNSIINGIPLSGYSMITQSDSVWPIDTNALVLGRRYEMKDTTGNFIGIDIAKVNGNIVAIKTGKDRAKMARTAIWQEDITKPVKNSPGWWNLSPGVVFAKGNYAIHIYQYNATKTLDTSLLSQLVPTITNQISE